MLSGEMKLISPRPTKYYDCWCVYLKLKLVLPEQWLNSWSDYHFLHCFFKRNGWEAQNI